MFEWFVKLYILFSRRGHDWYPSSNLFSKNFKECSTEYATFVSLNTLYPRIYSVLLIP